MILVNFDGSCYPTNPSGKMGCGFVVYKDGERVHSHSVFFEEHEANTNNLAEHIALNLALDFLYHQDYKKHEIYVFGDSRLVIQQMNESWRINEKSGSIYVQFALDSLRFKRKFENINFSWIPREQNQEADALTKDDGMPKIFESIDRFVPDWLGVVFEFVPSAKPVKVDEVKKKHKHRYYNPTVKKKVI